jgi:hypothetical protein
MKWEINYKENLLMNFCSIIFITIYLTDLLKNLYTDLISPKLENWNMEQHRLICDKSFWLMSERQKSMAKWHEGE